MSRLEKKEMFIQELAQFLSGDAATKSIDLEVEGASSRRVKWAAAWARLRSASPARGYMTVDETAAALRELL